MKRIFADVEPDVMLDAVYRYMKVGHYFPKPADLWPYVQESQEKARGQDWEAGRVATDADLYEMELARGTMPPLAELHDYWAVVAKAAAGEWQDAELVAT